MLSMKKTKLSFSSISMYNNCSLCYKLHYIDGVRPVKTKSYFIFGAAVDTGLNKLLLTHDLDKAKKAFTKALSRGKINKITHDFKTTDLIEYSKSDLDLNLLKLHKLDCEPNPHWHSLYIKGILFLEYYQQEILPKIKRVFAIQKRVSLQNSDGDKIRGFLDVVVEWEDGSIILLDHKTSSVKYKDKSGEESLQLNIYSHIVRYVMNKRIDKLGFIVFLKKFNLDGKVKCQIIINDVDSNNEALAIDQCDNANTGISNNIFSESHNSNGNFGKCPYYYYTDTNQDFVRTSNEKS